VREKDAFAQKKVSLSLVPKKKSQRGEDETTSVPSEV
jgi:hypothetical protein